MTDGVQGTLGAAIACAAVAFLDIKDKAGAPYILHCLEVMKGVEQYNDEEMSIAAVFHDLIEDTHFEVENLYEAGFSTKVCDLVSTLTKLSDESYDHYIGRIMLDSRAIKIKLADLEHNMKIQRMACLIDKDCQRIAKYHSTYHMLKAKLAEMEKEKKHET